MVRNGITIVLGWACFITGIIILPSLYAWLSVLRIHKNISCFCHIDGMVCFLSDTGIYLYNLWFTSGHYGLHCDVRLRITGCSLCLLSPAGAVGPVTRYIAIPPVRLSECLSVRLSVTFSFRTVTQKRIAVFSRNFAGTCTKAWGCAV